jgi:hypothetical protein
MIQLFLSIKIKNRMKQLLIMVICVLSVGQLDAQRMRGVIKRKTAEAAVMGNVGVYDGEYRGLGTNLHYMWGIGRNRQRFSIGLGLRVYNFTAKKREYVTSDASLVKYLIGGTDSIYFDKQNSTLMNTYLAFQIHIKRGIEMGFQFDLGGITFGGTKEGFFHSYELTKTVKEKKLVQPFAFNFNPFASGVGYGSTFNEVYFQFSGGNIMKYRLGFDYFVNEINSKSVITGNGTRFKTENYMVMGAVVWNIRHNKSKYDLWHMND